jgi:hypothetical protein
MIAAAKGGIGGGGARAAHRLTGRLDPGRSSSAERFVLAAEGGCERRSDRTFR